MYSLSDCSFATSVVVDDSTIMSSCLSQIDYKGANLTVFLWDKRMPSTTMSLCASLREEFSSAIKVELFEYPYPGHPTLRLVD